MYQEVQSKLQIVKDNQLFLKMAWKIEYPVVVVLYRHI